MIKSIFLKELILIELVYQKSVTFDTIGNSSIIVLSFNQMYAIDCHDLLIMSMKLSEIAVLNIKRSEYCSIVTLINKNDAINSMQSTDFTQKSGRL